MLIKHLNNLLYPHKLFSISLDIEVMFSNKSFDVGCFYFIHAMGSYRQNKQQYKILSHKEVRVGRLRSRDFWWLIYVYCVVEVVIWGEGGVCFFLGGGD